MSFSVYETNSDDETNKPASPRSSEFPRSHSEPWQSVVRDKDSAAATNNSVVELSEPEDVDGVGASKFSYMNAADVAEALHNGAGAKVPRVKSVHSDDEEGKPVQSGKNLAPAKTPNNPPSSVPRPGTQTLAGSTSSAAQNTNNSDDTRCTSSESPKSSRVAQSNESASDNSQETESVKQKAAPQSDVVPGDKSTIDKEDVKKVSVQPQRQVTMRRDRESPVTKQQTSDDSVNTDVIAPVVELHIDTDLKPTLFSDFELELLPIDSGSAVEQLRQFLDTDESRLSSHRSSHSVPTAIQPGKAFDSMKYFLSTLE